MIVYLSCMLLPCQSLLISTCSRTSTTSQCWVSQLDPPTTTSTSNNDDDNDMNDNSNNSNSNNIPSQLRISGRGIPPRNSPIQLLDTSTYESQLSQRWNASPEQRTGFDWEMEKARRLVAGLRNVGDPTE